MRRKKRKPLETPRKRRGGKRGPERIQIDWNAFDALCRIHCTPDEAASVLGVSRETLARRCKEEKHATLDEYMSPRRAGGRAMLRRKQFELAVQEGHPTMLIWLGKNMLGQADRYEAETRVTLKNNVEKLKALSPDDLEEVERVLSKLC
jgi:hypothetical protein